MRSLRRSNPHFAEDRASVTDEEWTAVIVEGPELPASTKAGRQTRTDHPLPGDNIVEQISSEQTLYTDGCGNTVFVRQDAQGCQVGAELRGPCAHYGPDEI